jgi:hypothetical protein
MDTNEREGGSDPNSGFYSRLFVSIRGLNLLLSARARVRQVHAPVTQKRKTLNPKLKTPASGGDLDLVLGCNIVLKENIPLAIPNVSMKKNFERRG